MKPSEAGAIESPSPSDIHTVLIIDDDAAILSLLEELISMIPGCRLLKASTPADAMRLIAENRLIDVVITDVHMPNHTGLDFVADLMRMDFSPEVIVMTAFPSGEIAQKAMDLGVSSLLAKPFQSVSLVEVELDKAFRRVLRKREALQAATISAPRLQPEPAEELDLSASIPTPHARTPVSESESESHTVLSNPSFISAPDIEIIHEVTSNPNIPDGNELAKIFDEEFARNICAIEFRRCDRYKRQLSVYVVQFDVNHVSLQGLPPGDRTELREETLALFRRRLRNSDIIARRSDDCYLLLAFECNKVGAYVVKQKLLSRTPHPCLIGTATYPSDAKTFEELISVADINQKSARKVHIVIYEEEEFFRSILKNMLADPKFNLTVTSSGKEVYDFICRELDSIQLFLFSFSKDSVENLKLLNQIQRENFGSKMKILMMTETIPSADAVERLKDLGVTGMIRKGSPQEEVVHIINQLILPKSIEDMRRHKRALVTVPVRYEADGEEHLVNSFTLSQGGMFLKDLNPRPAGSKLELSFRLPNHSEEFTCEAEVLYSIPYFIGVANMHTPGMAVRFVNLPKERSEMIDEFVRLSIANYFF